MKVLVILCAHEMNIDCVNNIVILNNYFREQNIEVDYCGISNQYDFHHYEHIIRFTYKIINPNLQLSKICDFITQYKSTFNYTWYIKIRPDIKLLEPIPFDILSETAINARARVYHGPKKIKYGMSVNGEGCYKNIGDCYFDNIEHDVILDDQLFIFHQNIIHKNAFDNKNINPYPKQDEYKQTEIWTNRNIPLNVVGIYVEFTKYNVFSGNLNF